MGMDPITPLSYIRHCNLLYNEMKSHYGTQIKICLQAIEEYYISRDLDNRDSQGNLEMEVSFDGTWMTRGHSLHIGISFVIEVYTCQIVDFEVLCNYCPICKGNKDKKGPHKCHQNFEGKSGSMEVEQATRLWKRSLQHGFMYTVFVGDGDPSANKAVCALNNGQGPYRSVKVEKEECINHVSKRMGTRLRKMKKEASIDVVTKKGKTIKKVSWEVKASSLT